MELYYLMSITDRERAEDMAALYRDAGLNLVTTMMGRGTATPQQLALYGLSRTEKAVTGAVVVAFDVTEQALAQRNRREFTANVSHELKTPLALIGTYAEGLREDIDGGGENRQYYCEVIEDEAHRVTQMLRRMTMLMQLEGGGSQLEICRFNAAELLGNLLERERVRFREKGAAVEWEYPGEVDVYADPFLIENVLTNYLSNALNHVTPGGVVRATVARPSAQRVRITVFNTGEPIPTEELPRIWESFYKVDKARTRAYGGSGIGLSVVAAIMKAHGMPYGVENTPDGVAFYIELESR